MASGRGCPSGPHPGRPELVVLGRSTAAGEKRLGFNRPPRGGSGVYCQPTGKPKRKSRCKEVAMRYLWSLAAIVCLAVSALRAQDPVKVAPKQCKVEFENEQVRVLRWKVGPHEK